MSTTSWRPNRPTFSQADRRLILARQPICADCLEQPSTIADHIHPIAEGGPNTVDNGQALCDLCHHRKTLDEQRRGLARHPRPTQHRQAEPHPGLIR